MVAFRSSIYQSMKMQILSVVNLTNDAVHIHIGLAVFFLTILIWKKERSETVGLVVVIFLALTMEAFDLFDDFRSLGYFRWSASIHDIINTIIWPLIIAAAMRFRWLIRRGM